MTDPSTEHRLLPIGELSRASGLTVSALRFYDREGLLVPAEVDAHTGYRRYSPGQVRQARLLAGMRRVGMPLAEMAAVLGALPDVEVAEDLLTAHLARLQEGLDAARREVQRLQSLLPTAPAGAWTAQVTAGELSRALDSVRYAVGTDPDFPMLRGVLVEPLQERLRLVATDRYRLAMAETPASLESSEPDRMPLLPTVVVDQLRERLDGIAASTLVRLQLSRTRARVEADGREEIVADCLDLDFPDYRSLLHDTPGESTRVPVADILTALGDPVPADDAPARVVLRPGGIGVGGGDDGDGDGLLLDRAFLWDAARATPDGHAVLPLGDQIAPLTIVGPDDRLVGMLMPVRPESHR